MSIVPVMIYVLVSVIHAERFINGGALVHELYRASGVSRYVTDSQQPVKRGEGHHFTTVEEIFRYFAFTV